MSLTPTEALAVECLLRRVINPAPAMLGAVEILTAALDEPAKAPPQPVEATPAKPPGKATPAPKAKRPPTRNSGGVPIRDRLLAKLAERGGACLDSKGYAKAALAKLVGGHLPSAKAELSKMLAGGLITAHHVSAHRIDRLELTDAGWRAAGEVPPVRTPPPPMDTDRPIARLPVDADGARARAAAAL